MTAGDDGRPGGWVPAPPAEPETQPVTRASLRAAREAQAREAQAREAQARRQAHGRPGGGRPAAPGADAVPGSPALLPAAASGVALSLLLGLSAYAGGLAPALAVAFAAVVMVWGWVSLTGAPSPRSATVVTGIGVLAICATAVLTRTEPLLVWVPATTAVSVVAATLHQVFRRHGRPRLTEGLASSISALAITACGVPLVALVAEPRGHRWVAVAMAVVAVAAALVVGVRRPGTARWVLLATVVLGTGVAVLAAWLVTGLPLLAAAVLGLLVSAVAHSLLRVLLELPGADRLQAGVAAGAASVLVVGVLVYLVARITSG